MMSLLSYGAHEVGDASTKTQLLVWLVPTYLVFVIQSALQCVVVEVVTEKEDKMKVMQQIYGLSVSMYWLSWGAYFAIISGMCIAMLYMFLSVASTVVEFANPLLFLSILLLSYAQQFAFAAILSVLFNRQQTASSIAGLVSHRSPHRSPHRSST